MSEENTYMKLKVLNGMFETTKEEFQKKFVKLYGFDLKDSSWLGHVLEVADYYLDFYDVMYAVNNNVHENELFSWYNYNFTLGEYCLGDISLESYVKGVRPYSDKDINELRKLQSEFNKAKSSLDDLLFKLRHGDKDN